VQSERPDVWTTHVYSVQLQIDAMITGHRRNECHRMNFIVDEKGGV